MNVLLTSAGRRSYLVHYFKQAVGDSGRVVCANMYADTPAMCAADVAVVVPPSFDEQYIPTIVRLCHEYDIGLICSFHDLDIYILSQHLDTLSATGAVTMLPSAEWGGICLDKYECSRRLEASGIDIPWTGVSLEEALQAISQDRLHLPVLVKARLGYGSLGLQHCHSVEELTQAYQTTRRQIDKMASEAFFACPPNQGVLIQQFVEGNEYCVDVVNDLHGRYVNHFACQVHAMRDGETDRVTTINPAIVGDIPHQLSVLTGHPGIWGVDVMDDRGVMRIIDINPRFTGDYPFHQVAGANIPAVLIAWARGEQPDPAWLKAEVGVRCYKDLVPRRID